MSPGKKPLSTTHRFLPNLVSPRLGTSAQGSFPSNYPATITGPEVVNNQPPFSTPVAIESIACPSTMTCIVGDQNGQILTTNNSNGQWGNLSNILPNSRGGAIDSIVCRNTSDCLAAGVNGWIYSTSNLSDTGPGASSAVVGATWSVSNIDTGNTINSLACPLVTECYGVDSNGNLLSSTNAFTPSPTWSRTLIDYTSTIPVTKIALSAIYCVTPTWCAATDQSGNFLYTTNANTNPAEWIAYNIDGGSDLTSLSCTSTYYCIATDIYGNVLQSPNPAGGSSTWSKHQLPNASDLASMSCPNASECIAVSASGESFMNNGLPSSNSAQAWTTVSMGEFGATEVTCPSTSDCFAVDDRGNILEDLNSQSTSASSWSRVASDGNNSLSSISCVSSSLCVGASGQFISTSTDAFQASPTWSNSMVGYSPTQTASNILGISCPTINLCIGVDSTGDIIYSVNPTEGGSTYNIVNVDLSTAITSISCPNVSLCVAVDKRGNILSSLNPTGQLSSWNVDYADPGHSIVSISCPSSSLCIALDSAGNILANTDPTNVANPSWIIFNVDGSNDPTSITCADISLCLLTDSVGNVIVSSNPAGGASQWNVQTIDSQTPLVSSGCTNLNQCFVSDSQGNLLVSTDPLSDKWYSGNLLTNSELTSFSCSQSNECLSVDSTGHSWIAQFNAPTTSLVLTPKRRSGWQGKHLTSAPDNLNRALGHLATSSFWKIPSSVASVPVLSVSCSTAYFCASATSSGDAYTYNGTSWAGPTTVTAGGTSLDSIACITSTSTCVGVDSAGNAYVYSGGWAGPTTVTSGGTSLSSVSCTSTSFCMAVGTNGDAYIYDGTSWTANSVDNTAGLTSISCPVVKFCAGVDSKGNVVIYNAGNWSAPQLIDGSGTLSMESISCPSAAFCAASDSIGDVTVSDDPTNLQINTPTTPGGIIGVSYSTSLSASGGVGPLSFSSGAQLPGGLSLSASGVISGTPTLTGEYGFTVTVTDSLGDSASINVTITVSEQPNLAITTVSLPDGVVGTPYSALLSATGGDGSYSWAVISGSLPNELSITPETGLASQTPSSTGLITGTPTTAQVDNIELEVTDGASIPLTAIAWLTITITQSMSPSNFQVLTSTAPSVSAGGEYSIDLEAQGGFIPYSWQIASGSLPPGLGLSPAGLISGIADSPGTYNLTISASDSSTPANTGQVSLRISVMPTSATDGLISVGSNGSQVSYGSAQDLSSSGGTLEGQPTVGFASSRAIVGYWLTSAQGNVQAYGDAQFYGSAGNLTLTKPIVGMAANPDGKGYWLVASDGGIFSYGDAQFYGSMGANALSSPIVGMAASPDGKGYWLVASDGGIFSYGDAQFYGSAGNYGSTQLNGSAGNLTLTIPIVGMAASPDGKGYWLVASDGGIFSYGDATVIYEQGEPFAPPGQIMPTNILGIGTT